MSSVLVVFAEYNALIFAPCFAAKIPTAISAIARTATKTINNLFISVPPMPNSINSS